MPAAGSARSPHALEINDQAFRRARDIMIDAAVDFQAKVADLLVELEARRLISLKSGVTPEALAQSLCDGARGTNQALPPIPIDELAPALSPDDRGHPVRCGVAGRRRAAKVDVLSGECAAP